MKFSRIQNLHISQTSSILILLELMFSRIQNLHISQTLNITKYFNRWFSRIQNLHISQTPQHIQFILNSLVEFKIYISLKLTLILYCIDVGLVEFKIYISLKPIGKIKED